MRPILLFLFCLYPLISFQNPTQLRFYRPFGDVIEQVKPQIVAHKIGVCLQQSKRILREEAWRCIAEGVTYDPCFVKPAGKTNEALCLQSPWNEEAILLDTNRNLDASQSIKLDLSVTLPWAVELVTGERCLATDQDQIFENQPVHYRCTDNSLLFGYLQRCKAEWSILKQNQNEGITTIVIKKAWF